MSNAGRAGVTALAVLAGCPDPPRDPRTQPPLVEQFEASATEIERGGTVRLSWRVRGADRVTLEGAGAEPLEVDLEGTREVVASGPLALALVASSEEGTTRAELLIAVRDTEPVRIAVFEVQPPRFRRGEALRIRWDAPGATSVTVRDVGRRTLIEGGPPNGGTQLEAEGDTVIELRADGLGGPVTATLASTLVVEPPAILRFVVDRPVVEEGQTIRVSWAATVTSTACALSRSGAFDRSEMPVSPTGEIEIQPSLGAHRLTLACDAEGGHAEESQTVVVVPVAPPSIAVLRVEPRPVGAGGTVDLAYRAEHTEEVMFERGGFTSTLSPESGRVELVAGPQSETVLFFARRGVLRLVAAARIEVSPELPAIQSAVAARSGDQVELQFAVAGATRVTVEDEADHRTLGEAAPEAGIIAVTLDREQRWIVVAAHGDAGVTRRRVQVGR